MSTPSLIFNPTQVERAQSFGTAMERFRVDRGLSRNRLALSSGIDPSYLTRCARGERNPPRRPIVEAMARTMCLKEPERRVLLAAAGYVDREVSLWDGCLIDVATVLQDEEIPLKERAEFRAVLSALARQWRARRVEA